MDGDKSRAGTWQDWPVAVIALGALLAVVAWLSGGSPSWATWLLIAFGAVALLVRRGAFASRR